MNATLQIGGLDLTELVAEGGLKWSRNDLDSDKSGRTLDGVMHRTRVAMKRKLSVTLRRLDTQQLMAVNQALAPQFVTVTYLDPLDGAATRVFYSSTVEAAVQTVAGGRTFWDGVTFSLIER